VYAAEGARLVATALAAVSLTACAGLDGAGTRLAATASPSTAALGVGVTIYPEGQRPSIPDISGTTLDGSALTVSTLRGSVVVVNVWASWCGPCRDESPLLGRVAAATRPAGVRFVGIDEQDHADAARSFAASAGTSYPHLIDEAGVLLSSLRLVPSSGIPSTLVLDRTGAVAARVIGPVDPATFQAVVEAVARTASPSRTS